MATATRQSSTKNIFHLSSDEIADFTFSLVKQALRLRLEGQVVVGSFQQAPVYLRGHKESCQTFRSAPLCQPLPLTDPTTAAGRTLSGKPPAAPGPAPSLLLEQ